MRATAAARRGAVTLLVAFSLLLLLAPDGWAGSVTGGSSPDDPAVLTPGTSTDTIRGQETSFYGVDVAPGQRLVATVHVHDPRLHPGGQRILRVFLFDSLRRAIGTEIVPTGGTAADILDGVRSPPAVDPADLPANRDAKAPAGRWILAVDLLQKGTGRVAFPTRLHVTLKGTATGPVPAAFTAPPPPGAAPQASGTPAAPRRPVVAPRPTPPATAPSSSGGGTSAGTLVLAAVLGLLAGGLAVLLAGRRRPRRGTA